MKKLLANEQKEIDQEEIPQGSVDLTQEEEEELNDVGIENREE